jgi:hypothetical protein
MYKSIKMKKIILIINVAIVLLCIGCSKKSVDFIADNTSNTGVGSIPVSSNPLIDFNITPNKTLTGTNVAATPVYPGAAVLKVELQYFSQSPVKEINLYETVGTGARTLVSKTPYAPAFSQIKRLDTLMLLYTVPTTAAANTGIKLEYEILNQNALSLTRVGWIKKNP